MPVVTNKDGQRFDVDESAVGDYEARGYQVETPDAAYAGLKAEADKPTDRGVLGQVTAGITGFASGATLGLSDVVLSSLATGNERRQLADDRAANPLTSALSQGAGAVLPALISPTSLLAGAPAGVLGRASMAGFEAGRAVGGVGGAARALTAVGAEGAIQNAGVYLGDAALGDRNLTAEGMAGALGTGFAFGAAGGAGIYGIEGGTMAARRMFARYAEGGEREAQAATQAWKSTSQETLSAHDAAVEVARARVLEAQDITARARLEQQRARAGVLEAKATPVADAGSSAPPSPLPALTEEAERLAPLVSEYDAARVELDDILRRLEAPEIEPGVYPSHVVPIAEFGAPGQRGYTPGEVRAPGPPAAVEAATGDVTAVGRRRPIADGTPIGELDTAVAPAGQRLEVDHVGPPSDAIAAGSAGGPHQQAAVSIDSPIEQLSRGQLEEYKSLIDDMIDDATPAEQQALFQKAGDAQKRIRQIEWGEVKDPHPYGTVAQERFTQTNRPAGGSQGGAWYRDASDQQWFGKHYGGDTDRLWSEHVANQIYRKMGVSTPETEIAQVSGRSMIMSKEVIGRLPDTTALLNQSDIHKGFVLDAWLGNRDVIGAVKDNIILVGDKAHRIDAGGATIWRAQGAQKTFIQKVFELESMRNPSRSAGRVFGKLTHEDIHQQLADFSSMYRTHRSDIDHLIDSSGMSREVKDRIKIGLHDRAAWLETEALGKVSPLSHDEYSALAKGQHAQLSEAETKDLIRYSGSPLFRELNSKLKTGAQLGGLSSELRGPAENIDAAIARSKMPRDSVVFRGINGKRSLDAVASLKPGDVYVDHGFGSTSRERSVADRLAAHGTNVAAEPSGPGVVMEISIPMGFPALAVPSATFGKFETELLLPRGARYIVTDVSATEGGQRLIKMAIREAEPTAGAMASAIPEHAVLSKRVGDLGRLGKPAPVETVSASTVPAGSATAELRATSPREMSGDEFDRWRGDIESKLSPEERDAVYDYLGGAYTVNRVLRTGEVPDTPLVRHIDALMAKSEIPADTRVSRLIRGDDAYKAVESLKPGDIFTENGYVSTSVSLDGGYSSDAFLARKGYTPAKQRDLKLVRLDIDVPKGSRGAPVFDPEEQTAIEREILLPRGQRFTVRSVDRYPDGQVRRLHLEAKGPSSAKGTAPPAPADTLTGQLRATLGGLGEGKSLNELGAPGRADYAAAKAVKTKDAAEHFRAQAKGDSQSGDVTRHIDADDLTPTTGLRFDPETRTYHPADGSPGVPPRPVGLDDGPGTGLFTRPSAVDDIAAVAGAATRLEKAAADITEAIGDAAPPTAQRAAKAFRDAEVDAERKTIDRTTRAVDDAAEKFHRDELGRFQSQGGARPALSGPVAASPIPGPPPGPPSVLSGAKSRLTDANTAYAQAQVAETEAKIGAKTAMTRAREAKTAAANLDRAGKTIGLPGPPSAQPGRKLGLLADLGAAVEVANTVGIPGVPSPRDIPVIGPLLSAYLKYRAVRAAAGRFVGRVPATAEAKAASLAAGTKDKIARAVDRSLGIISEAAPKARGPAVAFGLRAANALRPRAIESDEPDAPKNASLTKLAAVRIQDIAAAASDPRAVVAQVRREMAGVLDPDLIAAAEKHRVSVVSYLSKVAPKAPEANPYSKREWEPTAAQALKFSRQYAAAFDPVSVFEALHNQTLTVEAAETLRATSPALFSWAQERLISRAGDLEHPVPYQQRLRGALLFDVPLDDSLQPEHAAILATAHAPSPVTDPAAPQQGPSPSLAGNTNLTAVYQTAYDRRAMR